MKKVILLSVLAIGCVSLTPLLGRNYTQHIADSGDHPPVIITHPPMKIPDCDLCGATCTYELEEEHPFIQGK